MERSFEGQEIAAAQIRQRLGAPKTHEREALMPTTITLNLIAVWFCFGLFVSMGWTLGGWMMNKVCAAIDIVASKT